MGYKSAATVELRRGNAAIDITPFLRKFVWTESALKGGFLWSMLLRTDEWTEWADVLIGDVSPPLMFRLSVSAGDAASVSATSWRTAIVDQSKISVRGETLLAYVEGADARLLMQQKDRTRAWPASRISDVVKRVAAEHDLTPVVTDTPDKRDRWQLREDDWAFLSRLSSGVSTASDRGDVYLWVDERTLRMGAPDLAARSDRRFDIAHVEERVDRVAVGFQGRSIDRAGGSYARGVGYDLAAGTSLVFDMDAQAAASLPALAERVPTDPADSLTVITVTETQAAGVEERTRAHWGKYAPRYFSLRLDGRADLPLRPMAIIEMQANIDPRRSAPFFGRFLVAEVQHRVVNGVLNTVAVCFRREAFIGEAGATGASAQTPSTRDGYSFGRADNQRVILTAERLK